MAGSLDDAIQDADAILLLVKHSVYNSLDPVAVALRTRARIVIDTVNAWDTARWESAGFKLHRLGVSQKVATPPQ
jgi:UDP-N-acetyl-D-mannosaminuronate dehydrogenase